MILDEKTKDFIRTNKDILIKLFSRRILDILEDISNSDKLGERENSLLYRIKENKLWIQEIKIISQGEKHKNKEEFI